jgi:hypothetical protein
MQMFGMFFYEARDKTDQHALCPIPRSKEEPQEEIPCLF